MEPEESCLTSDGGTLRIIDMDQGQEHQSTDLLPGNEGNAAEDPMQDEGEVLLVEGLQQFQEAVEESGGVGTHQFQQYQPLVLHNVAGVQGFVTSAGEVLHVVQPSDHAQAAHQAQTQTLYPQVMHPDLYRLTKVFPDFSPKTLHRIFVMCHYDLKRALDQALFARQFRQLDSLQPVPLGIAPSPPPPPHAPHRYQHAPYQIPAPVSARAAMARPYVQAQAPVVLYPQSQAVHGMPITLMDSSGSELACAQLLQAESAQPTVSESILEVPLGSEQSPLASDVSEVSIIDTGDATGDVAPSCPTLVC